MSNLHHYMELQCNSSTTLGTALPPQLWSLRCHHSTSQPWVANDKWEGRLEDQHELAGKAWKGFIYIPTISKKHPLAAMRTVLAAAVNFLAMSCSKLGCDMSTTAMKRPDCRALTCPTLHLLLSKGSLAIRMCHGKRLFSCASSLCRINGPREMLRDIERLDKKPPPMELECSKTSHSVQTPL